MTGSDIAAAAREWIGVDYLHQGRTKQGVDCAGLIIGLAKQLGLDRAAGYVDRTDYPRQPTTFNMMELLRTYCDHRRGFEPQIGEILHFSFAVLPQHVAIYAPNNRIIHAYNSGRHCVIETSYLGKWPKRLHSIYRYKGVDY